ncbi:hypothetical protein SDC9_34954 [bioreactor metagenome]|jgi:nitrite reductase/ring-hydroxylating ferredoxin subunit|uniref:Rieske domain-containing protein n=1 Tax=bioreactor metagenome TaxID=1076179 RepID=A0A644VCS1_9ZZZZ
MKYGLMRKLLNLTGSILFILIISGCEDDYVSSIPIRPVYMSINLTIAPYSTLRYASNQYFVFDKPRHNEISDRIGYGGILLYAGFDENYYAFDLACPYEADYSVRIKPNDVGQAVCESCGSVYDISYGIGNPVEGPGKEALKRYKTSLQGDYIYITQK